MAPTVFLYPPGSRVYGTVGGTAFFSFFFSSFIYAIFPPSYFFIITTRSLARSTPCARFRGAVTRGSHDTDARHRPHRRAVST